MLDTEGYKHTLRICNTYCFSIATVDARTRLNVTLFAFLVSNLIALRIFMFMIPCIIIYSFK